MSSIPSGKDLRPAGLPGKAPEVIAAEVLRSEKGIALMVVLWVLAFLMLIVVEFAYTMRIETETVRNLKDETAARHLALAGINMGLAELGTDYDIVFIDKDARLALGKKEKHDIKTIDVKREFALGEGRVSYRIYDEEARLNINVASREQIKGLLRATGVDTITSDVIADSILDWRDENHEFHFNGAEDDYYGSLARPYGAKDGRFDTTEELLLVKGVTPEIFYGDGNVPHRFGLGPAPAPDGSRPVYEGLERIITVKGEGKINLNTADARVLEAVLGTGKSMEIRLRRETEGVFKWPMYGGTVTSRVFSIHSEGTVRGMKASIKAVAERRPNKPEAVVIYLNDGATGIN